MIGKVLKGIYRIYDKVGTGGFATVYLGRNLHSNEIVAIKVLKEEYTQEPRFVQRFRREARLAQSLDHPNIVRVLDYGVEDGRHFLVMDYVEGKTVAQIIRERGPLPLAEALSIVIQTCQALDHAYRAGIVHRDIKPQNLMVTPDGTVKVMDLGIAKATALATLTQSGLFMGTPRYISPEMAKGQKTDIRSDIYSLGIVLYEMLTGRAPFEAESPWAVLRDQIETVPRPLSALRRGLPPWVEAVVAKALAKEPAERFQTPAEMLAALQAQGRVATPAAFPAEVPTIVAGPAVRLPTVKPKRKLSLLLRVGLVGALMLVLVMGGVGIASLARKYSAGLAASPTIPAQTVVAEVPASTPTRVPARTPTVTAMLLATWTQVPSPTRRPLPTPTLTAKPTAEPTPTASPTATPSSPPTPTPEVPTPTPVPPTPTPEPPTPTPVPKPHVVVKAGGVNVRSGPGTAYPRLATAEEGQKFDIVARNQSGDWWQICCLAGEQGWVYAPLVDTEGPTDAVAVASHIPTPPPTPTPALPTPVSRPAPTLREPPDGASFSGKEAQIVLRWDSVGPLAEDEYYVVVILFSHGQETWHDEHWVKETSLQVPAYLPDVATGDRYEWSVTVMRQTGTRSDGMKEGVPVGPASATWIFTWTVTEGPPPPPSKPPTPTPPW